MTFETPSNFTTASQYSDYLNTTTNDLYGGTFLLTLFIVGILLHRQISPISITNSGFVVSLLAILFRLFGFVGDYAVFPFIIVTSMSAVLALLTSRG